MKISIPHRYAKNRIETKRGVRYLVFQFLIGTLKTKIISKEIADEVLFQFLIGTLKTWWRLQKLLSEMDFNSS